MSENQIALLEAIKEKAPDGPEWIMNRAEEIQQEAFKDELHKLCNQHFSRASQDSDAQNIGHDYQKIFAYIDQAISEYLKINQSIAHDLIPRP